MKLIKMILFGIILVVGLGLFLGIDVNVESLYIVKVGDILLIIFY